MVGLSLLVAFLALDSFVYFLVSLFVIYRDKKYLLNRMMFLIALMMSFYFLAECLMQFLLLPLEWLNLLRDLSITMAISAALAFLLLSILMLKGEEILKSPYRIFILLILYLIIIIIAAIDDRVEYGTNNVVLGFKGIVGIIFAYAVPLVSILTAFVIFSSIYRQLDEQRVKRRIILLNTGVAFIMLALIFWAVIDLLSIPSELNTVIGHGINLLGGAMIFLAFYKNQ
ncbi:MAG: hypothetical protein ACFFD4_13780 [Candidatus Odinarchaeota archaeon]